MYVVVFGNPFDGLSMTGPFVSRESAIIFCDGADDNPTVVEVSQPPEETGSIYDLLAKSAEAMDSAAAMLTDELVLPCETANKMSEELTELAMNTRDAISNSGE